MTVLLADDSPVLVSALKGLLSDIEGVEVIGQAGTVSEAIAKIGNLQPDVVILDMLMPGGTGLDVLSAIKKTEPAPVIIMLTNYSYGQVRDRCLRAGADAFFDKWHPQAVGGLK
ncbi:MAG: response regulator transcription factor [Acidobacteria bacterium]|nr:response regulator transcription factor [Acidobacteriota bacterium]